MGEAFRRWRALVRAAAAATSAFGDTRARGRRGAGAPPAAEPRGEEHMWAIVAGAAAAEQVPD